MRFDVIIIGGGLAGYAAGLRLLDAGKSCALVSAGQSALHFSSGSFDFLHTLPDGSPVTNPLTALDELARQAPGHPYALVGTERTSRFAQEAETLLETWDIPMTGTLERGNHFRMTPLAKLAPTWLSSGDALTCGIHDGKPDWPWESVALVSVDGFLDCYPEIVQAQLEAYGLAVTCRSFSLPALETIRKNPSEFRSINIARSLEHPHNLPLVVDALHDASQGADAICMPACIGLNDAGLVARLSEAVGKDLRLIPTLPPSLLGARLNHRLARVFLDKGGVVMPGDKAIGYELARRDGESLAIRRIYTVNHEDVPLEADHYVLGTGSFFSRGLTAEQQDVRETVFGLDMTGLPSSRKDWTADRVFESQPYAGFGVRTDAAMHGYLGGKPLTNLRVAGMILGGFDPIRQGCGAGVALVTALAAAHAILEREHDS